jgi:hypothetical protein
MKKGLFDDDFRSTAMKRTGHAGLDDFFELARRFGITDVRRDKLMHPFLEFQPFVAALTSRSFLDAKNQEKYLALYEEKRKNLMAR